MARALIGTSAATRSDVIGYLSDEKSGSRMTV